MRMCDDEEKIVKLCNQILQEFGVEIAVNEVYGRDGFNRKIYRVVENESEKNLPLSKELLARLNALCLEIYGQTFSYKVSPEGLTKKELRLHMS